MQPSGLAATQEALMSLITGRRMGPGAHVPESFVVGDRKASAAARIDVYAYMYRARIVEAMESQFPRVARYLRAHAFSDIVAAYVADEPSRNPSLRYIGQRFPAWLERQQRACPWLAELARLEWSRADVFDLPDEATLSLDELRALQPEQFADLPLCLIRARRIVISDYAVGDFWVRIGSSAHEADAGSTGDVADACACAHDGDTDRVPSVDPPSEAEDSAGESQLVWRQGTAVYHRAIAPNELDALEQIAAGTIFGALCERLLVHLPAEQATTQAFTWLSTWASDGLLATTI